MTELEPKTQILYKSTLINMSHPIKILILKGIDIQTGSFILTGLKRSPALLTQVVF